MAQTAAMDQRELSIRVLDEIGAVLDRVDPVEVDRLIGEILAARRVFIFAVGRVMLSLECFGKRLGHLGVDCQIVGSINEKPIGPEDLMLIASGSGESRLPATIAAIAVNKGAKLGLITSAADSTIKRLSSLSLTLPCPTKSDASRGTGSSQPMTSLFDQALHILGDVVALLIQQRIAITPEELWGNHANLE